jgi:hypothetical protein
MAVVWLLFVAGSFLLALAASAPWTGFAFLMLSVLLVQQTLRARGKVSRYRLSWAALLVVAGIFLLVPAALALAEAVSYVTDQLIRTIPAGTWSIVGITLIALSGTFAFARLWPRSWGERGFLVAGTLVFTTIRLLYVHWVDMTPVSDFAGMWETADRIAEGGFGAVRADLAQAIYLERVLPFLLPLRAAFGPEASSYAVANVFAASATSLVSYALARIWFGAMAARLAFVASQCPLETWLAMEIPSHDVPGAFFTLAALALFTLVFRALADRRHRCAGFLSLATGFSLVLVDLQRTTGIFVLAAGVAVGLLALYAESRRHLPLPPHRGWGISTLVLIPSAILFLGNAVWELGSLAVPTEQADARLWTSIGAHTDSWGTGQYFHWNENWARYTNAEVLAIGIESGDSELEVPWREIVLRKIASEIHWNPTELAGAFVRKVGRLFSLGSQFNFYLAGARIGDGVALDEPRERVGLTLANNLIVAVFLGLFGCGVIRLGSRPTPPFLSALPLIYLSFLTGALLMLGEVQPRFLYQIWYIGAIYVGYLWGKPGDRSREVPQVASLVRRARESESDRGVSR